MTTDCLRNSGRPFDVATTSGRKTWIGIRGGHINHRNVFSLCCAIYQVGYDVCFFIFQTDLFLASTRNVLCFLIYPPGSVLSFSQCYPSDWSAGSFFTVLLGQSNEPIEGFWIVKSHITSLLKASPFYFSLHNWLILWWPLLVLRSWNPIAALSWHQHVC